MSFNLTYARHKAFKVVNRIDHMATGLSDTAINDLYQSDDADLLMESVTLEDLDIALFHGIKAGQDLMMEAITTKKVRMGRTMKALSVSLNSSLNGTGLTASKDVEISKPRKSGAVAVITGKIALSDGQSVSVVFHAPDDDPLKINHDDTLIAFRFMLNGRDVTHAVAPNGGNEVSLKQVTMVLSNLAERNSEKFIAKQAENNGYKQEIEQASQQSDQLEADLAATSEQITQTDNAIAESNANILKLQNRIDKQNVLQEQLQAEIDGLKAQKMPQPEPVASAQSNAGGSEVPPKEDPEQASNDTPEGTVIVKGGYFTFNNAVWNVLDITSESVAIQARGDDRVEYIKKGELLAKRYVFTGFNDESEKQLSEAETIASKLDLAQYISDVRGKAMLSFGGQDVAFDALREAGFSIDDARVTSQKLRMDFNMGDYSIIKNPLTTTEPVPEPQQQPEAQNPVSDLQAIYDAVSNGDISLKIGKERVSGLMAAKPQSVQPSLREASGTRRKKAFLEALNEAIEKHKAYNPNAPVLNGYDFNNESYNVIDEISMFGKSWNEVGQKHPEKLFQYIEDSSLPDEVLGAAKAYYGQQSEQQPEQGMTKEEIDAEANKSATSPENDLPEPTEKQKESGNYKHGHVNFQGIDIAIENPAGSNRSGTDTDGNEWSVTMNHHYGRIKNTKGADGDQVDVFIGDNTESTSVFIVDQLNPSDDSFDEHKVMLGFNSEQEAQQAYSSNYADDWNGLGNITKLSIAEFKEWLNTGDTAQPMAKLNEPESEPEQPTSKLDAAVASLKELMASSSLNSDEYMDKMEKAFTAITEADKLDEYEPLMTEVVDKYTSITEIEEKEMTE